MDKTKEYLDQVGFFSVALDPWIANIMTDLSPCCRTLRDSLIDGTRMLRWCVVWVDTAIVR